MLVIAAQKDEEGEAGSFEEIGTGALFDLVLHLGPATKLLHGISLQLLKHKISFSISSSAKGGLNLPNKHETGLKRNLMFRGLHVSRRTIVCFGCRKGRRTEFG